MRLQTLFSTFVLIATALLLKESEQSRFEDERCVCACPRSLCPNGTGPIFIKMIPPNDCLCENVVHSVLPSNVSKPGRDICHFCKCQHESRNTTTIKVVVIFIICVVALLFVYMLFLMCLEPFIQQRKPPAAYERHIDDDVTLDNIASSQATSPTRETTDQGRAAGGAAVTQRSLLNRVTNEQQKWKGTVEEQRRNIYDYHSMLN